MRKARFAVLAATSIFFLHTQADRASAMPIASPSAIGLAASESGATLQVRYVARHHRYGAWRAPYERQYISHRYDGYGFPDGYGYNPGPYWGLGGYLNSWYT
jgi:hypothetical protein